jgi:glycosyltransferase involved in cell wall biosynthesis
MKSKLSVFIITYNEERIIEQCLKKLDWVDEIIVVDSGSTDATVAICEKYNAKVFYRKFEGYGIQKQFALEQTTNNWVLSLDSDEILTNELIEELKNFKEADNVKIVAYYLKRRHFFYGKVFNHGSESNRKIIRFFNKNYGRFDLKNVHENINVIGMTAVLKNHFLHYSFVSFNDYINKLNKYTQLYAENKFVSNKKYSLFEIIIKTKFEFFKKYFIELNFLNGSAGFYWSYISSVYSGIKCIKTNEQYRLNK